MPRSSRFVVISPDGLPIQPDPFPDLATANLALDKWVHRFAMLQGYYATADGEQIQIEELRARCKVNFKPTIRRKTLAMRVLAVARTRIEGKWCAYIDAVPGLDHDREVDAVLDRGAKLDEAFARVLFPEFNQTPYAP